MLAGSWSRWCRAGIRRSNRRRRRRHPRRQPNRPPPIASASVAPPASATASASATPTPPPVPTKSLQEILANAKTIKLTFRPKLDSNESKSLDITSPATIKAIVDAIGGGQHPEGGGPGYMPTFDLRFVDKDGNPARHGEPASRPRTMSDSNRRSTVASTSPDGNVRWESSSRIMRDLQEEAEVPRRRAAVARVDSGVRATLLP